MANKVYKDVVVPLESTRDDDPGTYARRKLNIDGTWKDHRYKKGNHSPNPQGFHFLEYASKNFKNPLEVIKANNPNGAIGSGSTTVAQTQQLNLDSFEQMAS